MSDEDNLSKIKEPAAEVEFKKPDLVVKSTIDSKFSEIFDIDNYAKATENRDEEIKEKIKEIEDKTDMSFLFGDDDLIDIDEAKNINVSSSSSSSGSSESTSYYTDSEEETNPEEKFEITDDFYENIVDREINSLVATNIDDILIDSLVEELENRVVNNLVDDLTNIQAQELSVLKRNMQETVINSILNTYLTDIITTDCEKIALETLDKQKIIDKIINEQFDSFVLALTKDFSTKFLQNEHLIEKYSIEYMETLVNSECEANIKGLVKHLKDLQSNLDNQINHVYENLITKFVNNEVEVIATSVYVNELKTRRHNKDVNFILSSMSPKPLIEPIKDYIAKDLPMNESFAEETIIETNEEVDRFDISSDSSQISDDEAKSQQRATPVKKTPTSLKTTRQQSSNIDTIKGQIHFLNKIKKTESCTSNVAKISSMSEISAIIKAKKKSLDAEISSRPKIAKLTGDNQLKRKYEDTTSPIKITTMDDVEPLQAAKRYNRTATTNEVTIINQTVDENNDNFMPFMHNCQKSYIKHHLASYFKTFNVKEGFRFAHLDTCIDKFLSPKSQFSVDLFLITLIQVSFSSFLFGCV